MATTTIQSGNSIASFGDSFMPSFSDSADIQVALKALYFGSTGTPVTTSGIYGALYTLYTGNPTLAGNLTVTGNLTVNGATTTINSTTITVDDKLFELGAVASPTNITADGGGLSLFGTTNKTIIWDNANANWTTSENWNLATGKTLKINNVAIASGTGAALVLGGNASTSITLGHASGTTTVLGTAQLPSGSTKVGNTTLTQGGTVGITLPTLAGTLVGSGDTGTVTSTMIANNTIVDADINTAAAIDKTKISGTAVTLSDTGTVTSTMIADGTIATADLASSTSTITGVTYGKMQYASGQYRVLGRISASSGILEELTPDNLITVLNQASTALGVAEGGTGITTVPTNGGILYGASSSALGYSAAGTSGNVLLSGGTGAPTWRSTVGTAGSSVVLATSPTFATSILGGLSMDVFNTGSTTLNIGGAATTLNIGAGAGTTTLSGTVNIPNTFQLAGTSVTTTGTKLNYLTSATGTTGTASTNIVFSTSPTITTPTIDTVSTSLTTTGTAALWNTGLTTGTISIGGALTTGTVNIASGTAGAKAVNIGTSTGTVGLNGKVSLSSAALSGTAVAARLEYNGDALFFTPKLNNSTAGRGLVPSDQILILNSNFGPTTVTSNSGDGLVTNTYAALNKNIYLAASQAYFVDMSIIVFHNLVSSSGGSASISFSLNATSGAQGQITAISVIDSAALTGGASTMEFFSGNANALSETLRSVSSVTDQGYSILKWSGVISNSIAGNFGPQITINATSGGGTTATAAATIQAGSYCKVTPLGATGSEINIGGWA
jgi:hypothetical protein